MAPKTLAEHFSEIEDPRHTGFAHRHDLVEMLVISTCALFSEVEGFEDTAAWAGCKRLGRVVSLRVEGRQRQVLETRYYISSAELTHEQLHAAVRQHWGIENRLHWGLDVIFREDDAKIRKDNGPRNIALIRKIILNMLRQDTRWPKASLRGRRKMAGWDDDERMRVLWIRPL